MYFLKVITANSDNLLQLPILLFPGICVCVYVLGKEHKTFGTLSLMPYAQYLITVTSVLPKCVYL